MRVAFVHSALAFYRVSLFNALSKRYDVEFFFHKKYGDASEKPRFKYRMLRGVPVPGISDYMYPLTIILRLIKGRYDLFIGAGAAQLDTMAAFMVAKLLRKPFVLWNVTWFYNPTLLSKLRYPIWRRIVLGSDSLVLPGKRAKMFHMAVGVPEDRISTSPNTSELEPDEVSNGSLKASLGFRDEDRIILCFSRISREKGLEYLVDSFRYINRERVKLLIATTLPPSEEYLHELENRAQKIGRGNIIVNVFHGDQKKQLYQMCDVFVLPSVTRPDVGPDVWGMTLNEALSMGKPLVATTSVGGAYDMIANGKNGYMVKPRDSKTLGKALRMLLDSPNLSSMGEHSREMHLAGFRLIHEVQGFCDAVEKARKLGP
ncbi:glycosyltransferase [Candidatus Bathyarchaeota archaeon]|nr:glycosyltransferase [Candidatus Bathyarchaeota archaeon]